VITEALEISNNKKDLEEKANYRILGHNAIAQSSKMARVGNHRFAQAYAKNWNRKLRERDHSTECKEARMEMNDNFKKVYGKINAYEDKLVV